jgi:hypothetical protein
LRNFLHSPVTSSLLGPNILLRVLKHPQSMLVPKCERPSFTPIQNNWQNYGFVYFNLYIPMQQAGRQKTLDKMVASIPRI